MKFFRFDKEVGFPIKHYDSQAAHFIKVSRNKQENSIGFIQLDAGGVVGYHQATVQQLFIVVQGEGWVTGTDRERISIRSGEGVMWEEGEWHESGSESGMLALVVEAKTLDTSLLQEK
ncbi:cupin domain-containing protein [Sutcliffiella horikoshii]|uniref:Cupin domain-containing protein n=1 Tax=Sutcliffiella horikoshii TaxID=79883 RepID=A0A5D4SZW9_9BACI|nr:cupin domain-containing protein [Sutcliffiella horikoshii]TYS68251.1 cupin domain-containing protein [Sutcliffiella horikoshii]